MRLKASYTSSLRPHTLVAEGLAHHLVELIALLHEPLTRLLRPPLQPQPLCPPLLRQYLYFCTSKTSQLSAKACDYRPALLFNACAVDLPSSLKRVTIDLPFSLP